MIVRAKTIGRPLRKGTNLDAAREAILDGCSLHETAQRSGVSMYMFYRLRRELRARTSVPERSDEEAEARPG